MRGEKAPRGTACRRCQGSPPHARGKVTGSSSTNLSRKITPACAGKSAAELAGLDPDEDHPRMRGEKKSAAALRKWALGSPPHARGKEKM